MLKIILTSNLLLIFGFLVWFTLFFLSPKDSNFDSTQYGTSTVSTWMSDMPVSGSVTSSTSMISSVPGQRILVDRFEKPITVRDFIVDKSMVPDPVNSGTYVLNNESTYCQSAGGCEGRFLIQYQTEYDIFFILIEAQSIQSTVSSVEALMLLLLEVNTNDLCRIRYEMAVPYWVSEELAGQSLVFPQCL